ncbi:MAG: DMT family transporter [Deltaproteobacteria bacterium]|nr:DMT family transporter [Deltaproteobacteria bacterium]
MADSPRYLVDKRPRALAVLAASAMLFGAMAVVTRTVTAHISAAQVAAIRFAIGLVGMGALIALRPAWWRATRPVLLGARGLFGALSVLAYFFAIQHVNTGMATLMNYTFPLWAAVFSAQFLGERITARMTVGMVLSLTGLVIVVGPAGFAAASGGSLWLGLALGIGSSVSGGAATTIVRLLRRTDSAPSIFTAFCAMGLVVSTPLALATWRPIPVEVWPRLMLIGLLSLCAQLMFTWALGYVPAGQGGMTTQLTVVASYGLAWLFLDEPVTPVVFAGAAVVMTGIWLVSSHRPPAPAHVPDEPE